VIEAGLGGRFDATNVIPSKVQVLTSVGLEHTRWLGPTLEDIAAEKLAVVRDYGTLVVGELPREILALARDVVAAHSATLVTAQPAEMPLRAAGGFQHVNFGLAAAAAEAFLGRPVEDEALRAAAAETVVPGRLEPVADRPLVLFDGAHNPAGARALAASLPDVVGARRPRVAVIGVLEDKDAAGMLETLLPHFDAVVFTKPENPRALSPATLVTLAEKLDGPPAETVPDPRAAVARAQELAGPDGAVLATGSIYLIADLVREDPTARASTL
jgi:dihydrofolate synthase / folylpolyglutamate synthase